MYVRMYLICTYICLHLYLCLFACLCFSFGIPGYPCIHLSIYLPTYPSVYQPIHLAIYVSMYLSIYLSTHLSIHLSVRLSIYVTCSGGGTLFCLHVASYSSLRRPHQTRSSNSEGGQTWFVPNKGVLTCELCPTQLLISGTQEHLQHSKNTVVGGRACMLLKGEP